MKGPPVSMEFKPACMDESAKATLWQTSCAITGPFLEASDGESGVQAQVIGVSVGYFYGIHANKPRCVIWYVIAQVAKTSIHVYCLLSHPLRHSTCT